MTLRDVGNYDEAFLDMCDYAGKDAFFVNDTSAPHVLVPYERSPHLTLVWGFLGANGSAPNFQQLDRAPRPPPLCLDASTSRPNPLPPTCGRIGGTCSGWGGGGI